MTEPTTQPGRALLDAEAPEYEPNPCKHRGGSSFDRSLCACDSMHDYCNECFRAIGCPLDRPEEWAKRREQAAEPIVAIENAARRDGASAALDKVKAAHGLRVTIEQITAALASLPRPGALDEAVVMEAAAAMVRVLAAIESAR